MRYPIWKKDDYFHHHMSHRIDMDPAVVELPDKPVPLTWQYDWERPPIGMVTDVKFEDGEISGEIEWLTVNGETWTDEMFEELEVRLGGFYTKVYKSADNKHVTACYLQAVSIMLEVVAPTRERQPIVRHRVCAHCGVKKPLNEECFPKKVTRKTGFRGICKKCYEKKVRRG